MLFNVLLCASLTGVAFGNSTADVMMDRILRDMAGETRRTGLEPSDVNSFAIKVKASGITTRDFKANFTDGVMYGIGPLQRQGNCSYDSFGSELRIGCYVSLGSVRFIMNADVQGDQIRGKVHRIVTTSTATGNPLLLIELQGRRNFPPELVPMSLPPVTMKTVVSDGKIDLNESRLNDFKEQTGVSLVKELATILTGRYSSVFQGVASSYRMP